MKVKFAFAGFRHGHINAVWNYANGHEELEIVANCEEDGETREQLASAGRINVTHDDYDTMLQDVECDVVAIGDYYQKHGTMVLKALQAGKHVIVDKPVCTSIEELDAIEQVTRESNLSVMSQFDLRGLPQFITMRNLIVQGAIGEVHSINVLGLHPLCMQTRPQWYFEPGKQGGTINDIAVHTVDLAEWMTGFKTSEVVAARAWNAAAKSVPHFQDGAQLMLRLENDCGVLSDVSYLAPNKCGYAAPQYWRVCCHGSKGVVETYCSATSVMIADENDSQPREIPLVEKPGLVYAQSLLAEIQGQKEGLALTTEEVLRASRVALLAQHAADNKLSNIICN